LPEFWVAVAEVEDETVSKALVFGINAFAERLALSNDDQRD